LFKVITHWDSNMRAQKESVYYFSDYDLAFHEAYKQFDRYCKNQGDYVSVIDTRHNSLLNYMGY